MDNRRFVAYYRLSTKQQGLSGLGMEAQEAAVLRHVGPGDVLVASFTDVESGTRKGNRRPELAKALAANVNPKIVSECLGHSTITLTLDTYSHVLPTMQPAAADQLEAILFG